MVNTQWIPLVANEEAKAREIEKEYAKYQEQKELEKRKKLKEASDLDNLKRQVAMEKEKDSKRNEQVTAYNEKLKLQQELSSIKSARAKAVTQNVKNIFTNIGTTFGNVGKSLGMGGSSGQGQTAQAKPMPVRRTYQPAPVMQQQPQQIKTQFNMDDLLGGFGGSAPQPVSYMPRVKTRVKAKLMSQRRRKLKGRMKKARRTTLPRIRRMNRMPVRKQKGFDINDVLRGMPQ